MSYITSSISQKMLGLQCARQCNPQHDIENFTQKERVWTSMRRFRCQCCSCSCWVRQGPPCDAACKRPPSMSIGMGSRSSSSGGTSFSCSVDKARQSNGLHSPKSDSFMCPYLSSNKLSGLMSLVHSITRSSAHQAKRAEEDIGERTV